ncbi:hypothetical protein Sste5346_009741 [Sporothrix stenoceras]|uniref:Cell cycle control protein n=1 Tax=Sporothrix stenoceras TaxID=5173 RepID=A0ABR3YK23_9PEZI
MARPTRPEPDDIIDLTEEPDSPVLQHAHAHNNADPSSHPFRTAARSAARSSRSTRPSRSAAAASAQSSNVIDLTDVNDDDDVVIQGSRSHGSGNNNTNRRNGLVYPDPDFEREQMRIIQQQRDHLQNLMRQQEDMLRQEAVAYHRQQLQDQREDAGSRGSIFGNLSERLSGVAQLASMAFGGGGGGGSAAAAAAAHNRRVRSARHQSRSQARAANRPVRPEVMRGMGIPAFGFGNERFIFDEVMGMGGNPLGNNVPDLNYQFNGGLFVNPYPHQHPHQHGFPQAHAHPDVPQRPVYPAPAAAPDGYTRTTGEDLVAVCAGCDVELAYDPDEAQEAATNEPPKKKTSRNRKDREEHYFWAVTTCGHVFCKSCYENRRNCLKKEKEGASSGSTSKAAAAPPVVFVADGKAILCAVDNCMSDVTTKKAWVGLFV